MNRCAPGPPQKPQTRKPLGHRDAQRQPADGGSFLTQDRHGHGHDRTHTNIGDGLQIAGKRTRPAVEQPVTPPTASKNSPPPWPGALPAELASRDGR